MCTGIKKGGADGYGFRFATEPDAGDSDFGNSFYDSGEDNMNSDDASLNGSNKVATAGHILLQHVQQAAVKAGGSSSPVLQSLPSPASSTLSPTTSTAFNEQNDDK